MTKHATIIKDLKEILQTIPRIADVVIGKHISLDSETAFATAYLIPGADAFEVKRGGTGIASYDNAFFIRCLINEDCSVDELQWADTRDEVIQAVLKDSQIWSTATDRDVTSVVYDDMNSFPKMTMEIVFEFTIREICT